MKNFIFTTALIFFSLIAYGQIFEIAQDKGYRHDLNAVLNVGDSMWVMSSNHYYGTVGEHNSHIQAIDNEGNIIWEYPQAGSNSNTLIHNLLQIEDGSIVAIGLTEPVCDVFQASPLSVLFFSLAGDLINTQIYDVEVAPWPVTLRANSTSEMIFASYKTYVDWEFEYYELLAISQTGESLWTENFGENEVLNLSNFTNLAAVFFENQIVLVDEQGVRVDSVSYAQAPIDVIEFNNNSLLALWQDGIYTINSALEIEQVIIFEADASTNILFQNNIIYLISNNEVFPFNLNYEPGTSMSFSSIPYFTTIDYAINNNALAIIGSKKFEDVAVANQSAYRSGVFYTVSLEGEQLEHFPDLAIVSFWIDASSVVQTSTNPILFTIEIDVSGYIVNTGDVTVNSANVTFIGDQGICGFTTRSNTLENIMLAPGDSVLFELNELRYTQQHFPSGNGSRTFCVFVSEPGNLSDRDETNDIACVTQSVGVGIFEHSNNQSVKLYPNPASDRVFIDIHAGSSMIDYRIFDLSGRLVQNGFLPNVDFPELNVRNLQRGSYLLHLQSENTSYAAKIIIAD